MQIILRTRDIKNIKRKNLKVFYTFSIEIIFFIVDKFENEWSKFSEKMFFTRDTETRFLMLYYRDMIPAITWNTHFTQLFHTI